MSERSIVSARAAVMVYDEVSKKWVSSGSSPGLSNLDISSHQSTFRIIGRKISDGEIVLKSILVKGFKYNQATPTFHQWRENRQVIGLNFASKDEADSFAAAVADSLQAMAMNRPVITSPQGPPPPPPGTAPSQISPPNANGPPAVKSAGPPPPPPPPPMATSAVIAAPSADTSLASALGSARLNKTNPQTNSAVTSENGNSQQNSGNCDVGSSGGGGSLMDEMARAFAKRKAGNTSQKENSGMAFKAKGWSGIAANLNSEIPKQSTQISCGLKPLKLQPTPITPDNDDRTPPRIGLTNNNIESEFDALKCEIIREVREELSKIKFEIIEGVRLELSKVFKD